MRRRVLVAATLVAATLAGWTAREQIAARFGAPVIADASPSPDGSTAQGHLRSAEAPTGRVHRLVDRWQRSSLRGSAVDGMVTLDEAGAVRADLGLRRLFDYFLSLAGEFTADEIRELLKTHVAGLHGDAVTAEVLALFDRYLGLRQASSVLAAEGDLAARFAALRALRRDWFGDDAEALFGADEAHTAHTLERLALLRDDTLDAAERAARLDELDARRPAAERAAEQDSLSAVIADGHERLLAEQDVPATQRHAERAALWGEEAAARLAALDAERAAWDARLDSYRINRDRILADQRLSPDARRAALDALLRDGFSEAEQRRIISLEAIGALPGG